ncbi:AgmX/PglI C-terminal domain-containing protein [Bdellovibrionota bacterium FG-2]
MKRTHHRLSVEQYRIQMQDVCNGADLRSWRWDGVTPVFCDPARGLYLERVENKVVVRMMSSEGMASSGDLLLLAQAHKCLIVPTPDGRARLRVTKLYRPKEVMPTTLGMDSGAQAEVQAAKKRWHAILDSEDSKNKSFKIGLGLSAAVLALWFNFGSVGPKFKVPDNEELIPPQVARLILKSSSSSHAASSSRALRAIRSLRVQHSLHRLVGGGLIAVSRALASSKSLSSSFSGGGSGMLRMVALGSPLAGGVEKIGSSSGYGQGTGSALSVSGQGRSLVYLNTEQAQVEEGLTKEEVARVIHSHLSEVRYCYESAILKQSHLEGKVVIDFKVVPQGTVGAAHEKETTLSDATVGSCVVRRMLEWKFPKPRGGVVVAISYPFLFKTVKRE